MPVTTESVVVPGARLYYEVRGSGPVLLAMGSPMGAALFAPLADALAGDFTVVTHDPRGIAGSSIDDPEEESTPELRADDVAALMDALGARTADVFGSSGGAVTCLALATRQPGRVRTLVAHEPPLLDLLPDAPARHAATEDIIDTFHRDGLGAAWYKFMINAGFEVGEDGELPGPPGEPTEQDLADGARFFVHELRHTTRYVPDIEALRANTARVVVGIGAESGTLVTHATSTALAKALGESAVEFPGDHGGFIEHPSAFAATLRSVLST